MQSSGALILLLLACAALSAALTGAALMYAWRKGLHDLPGRRRSHVRATPRGGGVGIVVAMTAGLLALQLPGWGGAGELPAAQLVALVCGLLAVGGIGWLDDHRPQPALVRLVVHALASIAFVWSLHGWPVDAWSLAVFALHSLLLMTAINFWNFMDGIDGLASLQFALVAAAAASLALLVPMPAAALPFAVAAAAAIGFVPFNFPRSRIFLGDVGSGALGFAAAALLLHGFDVGALHPAAALLLPSAFAIDAGLTLLWRMLAGRRWYTAHREHLYQWMVRSGLSHAQVVGIYMIWSGALVVILHAYSPGSDARAAAFVIGAYASGAVCWWYGRRRALAAVRRRAPA